MKFRSLTGIGDWNFGQGLESYATENNAIAFDVKTSILSFLKDCWFDPSAGIDWLRLLGTPGTQNEIQLTVRGIILQCYGVTAVNSVSALVNGRSLTVTYNINTIFTQNYSNTVVVI
jgi:hypothetical protein